MQNPITKLGLSSSENNGLHGDTSCILSSEHVHDLQTKVVPTRVGDSDCDVNFTVAVDKASAKTLSCVCQWEGTVRFQLCCMPWAGWQGQRACSEPCRWRERPADVTHPNRRYHPQRLSRRRHARISYALISANRGFDPSSGNVERRK